MKNLFAHVTSELTDFFGEEHSFISSTPISGGSINHAYQLKTNQGDYFLKFNQADKYPNMFEAEMKGLKLLHDSSTFHVPQPFLTGTYNNKTFLLTEYIEISSQKEGFWESFAQKLAHLHKNSSHSFGLDHNNYIGALPQENDEYQKWPAFFVEKRLMIQEKKARDAKKIDSLVSLKLNLLYKKMENLFPEEKPSLLHGDLWSGNFMVDSEGEPVIMDPAVYFGHREMDIAMTQLFGGFDSLMIEEYNSNYPMEKGWQERIDLCNLYPLMVHVNLFGESYLHQVKNILNRFVS